MQKNNKRCYIRQIIMENLFFTAVRSTWNQFYPPPKISNWIPTKIRNLNFTKYYTELVLKSFYKK